MTELVATVVAGVALGGLGSGHCVAMCGPLVLLTAPRAPASSSARAWHATLHHGGRVFTYVLLGLVLGLAGAALVRAGVGRALAIVAGMALVAQALASLPGVAARLGTHRLARVVALPLIALSVWLQRHRVQGPLLLGVLNGLLPCGLLYAALMAAVGLGDASLAGAFMAAFGLGTVPVLAALGVVGGTAMTRVPIRARRLAPVALAIVGILLIVRGIGQSHGVHVH